MNIIPKKSPFTDRLLSLLPNAQIENIETKNWFSATFSGHQISLSLSVATHGSRDDIDRFTNMLPDHDFDLRGHFVGEISCPKITVSDKKTLIMIDALLIAE